MFNVSLLSPRDAAILCWSHPLEPESVQWCTAGGTLVSTSCPYSFSFSCKLGSAVSHDVSLFTLYSIKLKPLIKTKLTRNMNTWNIHLCGQELHKHLICSLSFIVWPMFYLVTLRGRIYDIYSSPPPGGDIDVLAFMLSIVIYNQ